MWIVVPIERNLKVSMSKKYCRPSETIVQCLIVELEQSQALVAGQPEQQAEYEDMTKAFRQAQHSLQCNREPRCTNQKFLPFFLAGHHRWRDRGSNDCLKNGSLGRWTAVQYLQAFQNRALCSICASGKENRDGEHLIETFLHAVGV
jgi:hypothetical protein